MTRGVVYIASGEKYIEEALNSVRSLKEHNPDLNTTLYTDEPIELEEFDNIEAVNDKIDSMIGSIIRPYMTPYDRNLFLDSDTYITDNISEIFEVLERFDMAFTQGPRRNSVEETPECITEYNTGVVAYRDSKKVKKFLEDWLENQEDFNNRDAETGRNGGNQHMFAKTVYNSDIDYLVLRPEYNARVPICGYLHKKAKIIHGRPPTSLEKVAETLNKHQKSRIHYATQSLIGSGRKTKRYSNTYMIQRALETLKKQGLKSLLEKAKTM